MVPPMTSRRRMILATKEKRILMMNYLCELELAPPTRKRMTAMMTALVPTVKMGSRTVLFNQLLPCSEIYWCYLLDAKESVGARGKKGQKSKKVGKKEKLRTKFDAEFDETNAPYNELKDEMDKQAKVGFTLWAINAHLMLVIFSWIRRSLKTSMTQSAMN
jgi:hypothetical protein